MNVRRRRPLFRTLRLAAVAVFVAAAVFALIVWSGTAPPDLDRYRSGSPPTPWSAWREMSERARLDGRGFRPSWRYVPLGEVSLHVQAAAVVAEDIGFLSHEGVDWGAVREALQEWVGGEGLRGASTITQQTARNLFLSSRRSLFRKLAEARIARALENELGKRRILELYLNIAEFGDQVLGVEAAAWRYYGRTAAELTAAQAVGLCAALPSPRRDNPATATRTWEFRSEVIQGRLDQYDWLYRRLLPLHPEEVAAKLAAAIAVPDTTVPSPADTTAAAPPDTVHAGSGI